MKLRNGSVTVRSRRRKLWEKTFPIFCVMMLKFPGVKELLREDCPRPAKTAEVSAADAKLALLVQGRKSRIAAKKLQSTKLC